jgi:tetratricopeptide (TPR) repeat protein
MKTFQRVLILFFCIASAPLFSQDDPFAGTRDRLRDGSEAETVLASLIALSDPALTYEGSRRNFEIEYQRLTGVALMMADRKEEAREALRTSLALAEEARAAGETSRILFYLSSGGFLLASLDGIGAIISRADELNGILDRALALDPTDGEIIYQKASGLAYPPRLFGGDPARAIDMVSPLLGRGDLPRPVRFDLLAVYAYSLSKLGKYEEAVWAADRALSLYQGNESMRKNRNDWKRKVK